jgi:phosphohistidine phosphatase
MILYFFRHGLAGNQHDWKGDDRERPLTHKGKNETEISAETLTRMNLGLEQIITSPLTRARQTAAILAGPLKLKKNLQEDERLAHGFDIQKLGEILAAYPGAKVLMLVGHEPDFSAVISDLTGGSQIELKKGGLARVDIMDPANMEGVLAWLLPPHILTL